VTALVYVRGSDGKWTQQATLTSPVATGESDVTTFGGALAIDGDRLVVGASAEGQWPDFRGAAYAYERVGGQWNLDQRITDDVTTPRVGTNSTGFGSSVAISGDTMVVGDAQGFYAFVYTRSAGTWQLQTKLVPSDDVFLPGEPVEPFKELLDSVAIEGDRVVLGSTQDDVAGFGAGSHNGVAVVFDRTDGAWSQTAVIHPPIAQRMHFGAAIALHGGRVLVGAPWYDGDAFAYHGAAFLYSCGASGATLLQTLGTDGGPSGNLGVGTTVALSPSGTTAVVGTAGGKLIFDVP
jgi:hypothetical protein